MPCYTAPHSECKHDETKTEEILCDLKSSLWNLEKSEKYYKEKSDQATRLLCDICSNHSDNAYIRAIVSSNDELRKWWEEHKKFDYDRKHR